MQVSDGSGQGAAGTVVPADLVGRDTTVADVGERLRHARIVTITGPGGIGKTRVAEALAAQGGTLVDLAATSDHLLIPSEVARTLDLRLEPALPPLEALVIALAGGERLLVLDNLEQVDRPAAAIEPLLAALPGLRILATSRVPLGVRGEAEVAVGPLDLPAADDPASVEASSAGALFLRRARAIGTLPVLDEADARDVAALCRIVDGIPLGLELAARRLRVLSLASIVRRLSDGDGAVLRDPDRPDRQRSLDAVLDWSLSLLTPDRLQVLAAATACAGDFDVDILASLLPGLQDEVMDALDGLVVHGLVWRMDVPGEPRFRVLETVRGAVRRHVDEATRRELSARYIETMVSLVRRHGWRFEDGDAFDFAPLARERDGSERHSTWRAAVVTATCSWSCPLVSAGTGTRRRPSAKGLAGWMPRSRMRTANPASASTHRRRGCT